MIWVSGSKGMLGSHIVEKLSKDGIPFVATDIDIDITNPTDVTSFIIDNKPDWIIICSAYTAVDQAEDDEKNAFLVNAEGVKNIAAASSGLPIKIINFSTDYVFPGTSEEGYSEDDAVGPESVYGTSKLEGEKILSSIHNQYFIFRISWLYGSYGKNFVHTMLKLFEERDELKVVNDQFGSPTYTGELSNFILELIESKSDKYGTYHFSGEGCASWYAFAVEIKRIASEMQIIKNDPKILPVGSSEYPAKAKRPAHSYLLKDKLFQTFQFRPAQWQIMLEKYLSEYKQKM